MKTNSEVIHANKILVDAYEDLIENLEFKSTDRDILCAQFTLTIFEMNYAIHILSSSSVPSISPVISRSMLEAFVNLVCLIKDKDFHKNLTYDDACQNTKIFKNLLTHISPSDEIYSDIISLHDSYSTIKAQHEKNNIKYIGFDKRLKLADLVQFNASYNMDCSFTHNNILTLSSRHGDVHRTRELTFKDSFPTDRLHRILSGSNMIMFKVIQLLPNYSTFEISKVHEFVATHKDSLQNFDALYLP